LAAARSVGWLSNWMTSVVAAWFGCGFDFGFGFGFGFGLGLGLGSGSGFGFGFGFGLAGGYLGEVDVHQHGHV
jgi:hypothetical protein